MKSLVVKRSIVIAGHKTSVSLEDAFWSGLKEIAHGQYITLSNMVGEIDTQHQQGHVSSAIRLLCLIVSAPGDLNYPNRVVPRRA